MNTANLLEINNTVEEVGKKFNSMIDHIILELTYERRFRSPPNSVFQHRSSFMTFLW